jgi:hypothetical protein
MAITFEEVTAEVVPERTPGPPQAGAEGAARRSGDDTERIQRELALRTERLQRASAD